MPIIELPLMKGLGKRPDLAEYSDLLPANMLAVSKEVAGSSGYMHPFPGIVKTDDIAGVSRGGEYNTKQNTVYRVAGDALYHGGIRCEDIHLPGSMRVSMAHSYNSQGIAADGRLYLYRHEDNTLKELENWPEKASQTEGYQKELSAWTHNVSGGDAFYVPAEALNGRIVIRLTPTNAAGVTGDSMDITEDQWGSPQSQSDPGEGKPFLTDVTVTGEKLSGSVVTLAWMFKGGGRDATKVTVNLSVEEVTLNYAQYDIGQVRDICHNRSRYVWVKDGTDNFGITDLEDETHPDQFRPFYRAESMPDGIQGVASWRDMVVCFGTATTEYFSLTGSSSMTDPVYISQPSLMVDTGIAGTFCKCHYAGTFAILSHPARGTPGIYVIDSGSKKELSTPVIRRILRSYRAEELAEGVLESVSFDGHELLLVHLARHVLCFDATASTAYGLQWCLLETGLDKAPWQGIDILWDGNSLTLGDKYKGRAGELDFSRVSQYAEDAELRLYTPLLKVDNRLLFDLEVESAPGLSVSPEQCFISATTDGSRYGREQMVTSVSDGRNDRRLLVRRIGRSRKNIGFCLRFVTSTPISLASCRIRISDG